MSSQCKAIRRDGQPCTAKARVGLDFCFFHDPASKADAREAQAKGGSKKVTLEAITPWRGEAGDVTVMKSPMPAALVNLL